MKAGRAAGFSALPVPVAEDAQGARFEVVDLMAAGIDADAGDNGPV